MKKIEDRITILKNQYQAKIDDAEQQMKRLSTLKAKIRIKFNFDVEKYENDSDFIDYDKDYAAFRSQQQAYIQAKEDLDTLLDFTEI